jgi:CHAT domain-containing protein
LERGQAQALNGALGIHRDHLLRQRLRGEHPGLFARYKAADDEWYACQTAEPPDTHSLSGSDSAASIADLNAYRRRTDEAWAGLNAIVDEINMLPGYETFHAPATLADVTAAVAPARPLVYVATTSAGTLMLLIHDTGGAARVEGLWADFSTDDLDRLLFRRSNPAGNVGPAVGGLLPAQDKPAPFFHQELTSVLPTLGQRLMGPLAARLRTLGVHQVTLVPSGRLGLLPLHAATYSASGGTQTFLDEFTVTYAPSVNAAEVSRARANTYNSLGIDALIVGDTLMEKPLLFARQEAELVKALFLGRATLLLETDATHDAVWEAMHGKNALHFACHGIYAPRIPRRAGLAMADGRLLSLNGIRTARLHGVRLVTLSACQTALIHYREMPDEVIGLPAAFLEAGAAGVVGSLWPVEDGSTMLLMKQFYRRLLVGIAPAEALRQAQRALRTMTRRQVSEYFKAHMSPDTDWASIAHEKLPPGKPDTCPYAGAYHWAGFTFTGA